MLILPRSGVADMEVKAAVLSQLLQNPTNHYLGMIHFCTSAAMRYVSGLQQSVATLHRVSLKNKVLDQGNVSFQQHMAVPETNW